MDFPAFPEFPGLPTQAYPHPHGGWPGNELEEVLAASLGVPAGPSSGARIVEVLGRSFVWVPLPNGGGPNSGPLDLPTLEIAGQAYVPVFSSEEQFRQVTGGHMSYTIAPAVEFARGLPPQIGIAVNPDGVVGVPLPPPRSPSCAVPGVRLSTDPRAAAGCGSSSPTGRTTRWTSCPRPPPSSPGPASC